MWAGREGLNVKVCQLLVQQALHNQTQEMMLTTGRINQNTTECFLSFNIK